MKKPERIALFSLQNGTIYVEKGVLQFFSFGVERLINLILVVAIVWFVWQMAQPHPAVQLSTYQVIVKPLFSTDEEIQTEISYLEKAQLEVVDTSSFSPQNYAWVYNYTPEINSSQPIKFQSRLPSSEIERRFMKKWVEHEGIVLTIYHDTKRLPTIGIGHLMAGGGWKIAERVLGRKLTRGSRITREEAQRLFEYDVEVARNAVQKNLPDLYQKLNKIQQLTLVEMAFNTGIGNVLKFRTMLSRLRSGDSDGAARAFGAMLICRQVKERRCGAYQRGLRGQE